MLIGKLDTSSLETLLTGKGTIISDEGTILAGQDF